MTGYYCILRLHCQFLNASTLRMKLDEALQEDTFKCLFILRERERERERERPREGQREGERESEAGSELSAQSPTWGSISATVRS